jgi:hypothetical protein
VDDRARRRVDLLSVDREDGVPRENEPQVVGPASSCSRSSSSPATARSAFTLNDRTPRSRRIRANRRSPSPAANASSSESVPNVVTDMVPPWPRSLQIKLLQPKVHPL